MQNGYYIVQGGLEDGPHDLVTLMRRIKAGKIAPDTFIIVPEGGHHMASDIPELSLFFNRTPDTPGPISKTNRAALMPALRTGWQFTQENSMMTVFAGGLLLLTLLAGLTFTTTFGYITGGLFTWVLFAMLHNIYMVFGLRLHRGQTISSSFTEHQLAPVFASLMIGSAVLATMIIGGTAFLLIPGIFVAVAYIFMPYLMLDHQYNFIQAMHASRLLLSKHHGRYIGNIAMLLGLHLLSILLIVPLPVTLPIFVSALAECYDELIAS